MNEKELGKIESFGTIYYYDVYSLFRINVQFKFLRNFNGIHFFRNPLNDILQITKIQTFKKN